MSKPNPGRTLGSERTVAARLVIERKKRGWTYDTVARRMEAEGVPIQISALHKMEKGDPPRRVTLDEAIALANVFGITLEELVMPLELVAQQRAQEIARELHQVKTGLDDAIRQMLRLFLEYTQIAGESAEMLEFINNHHRASDSGPSELLPLEEFGELDERRRDKVTDLSHDLFNGLMALAMASAKAERS